MALLITVTDAGRAALVNASNTGTAPVTIAQVGISATAVVPGKTALTLPGEIKRIAALSGDVVADDTIHLIVRDETAEVFTVRSLALYLADGTLFGIYGQPGVILEKSAQALMLLAIDVRFEDIDATQLTFGDANFLNPPATTEVQGVVELSTEAEATTGADALRAVTPRAMKAAVNSWINSRFGEGAPSDFMKGSLTALNAEALRLLLGLKSAALKDEGANKGLDADLLDGQHGDYYTNIAARLGFTPVNRAGDTMTGLLGLSGNPTANNHAANKAYVDGLTTAAAILAKMLTVDGAGSGIDADLLDGQHGTYYADIAARLGYTPVNKAGDTMTGLLGLSGNPTASNHAANKAYVDGLTTAASILAKLLTVDGAGSGLDADLLRGLHWNSGQNVTFGTGNFQTPNEGSGGVRVRTNPTTRAATIQFINPAGTVQYGNVNVTDEGAIHWAGALGMFINGLSIWAGGSQNLSVPGFKVFPDNFKMMWGAGNIAGNSSMAVTFPLSFQQSCLFMASGGNSSAGVEGSAVNTGQSLGQGFVTNSGTAGYFTWWAWGV